MSALAQTEELALEPYRSALHDWFVYAIRPGAFPGGGPPVSAQVTTDAASDFIWYGLSCFASAGGGGLHTFDVILEIASRRANLITPDNIGVWNANLCGDGNWAGVLAGSIPCVVWFDPVRIPKQTTISAIFNVPVFAAVVELDLLGYRVPVLGQAQKGGR